MAHLPNLRRGTEQTFAALGIEADFFPETVENTGFSAPVMGYVSRFVASTLRPFSIESCPISALPVHGTTALTVCEHPVDRVHQRNRNGYIQVTTADKQPSVDVDVGEAFLFQLFKENGVDDDTSTWLLYQ